MNKELPSWTGYKDWSGNKIREGNVVVILPINSCASLEAVVRECDDVRQLQVGIVVRDGDGFTIKGGRWELKLDGVDIEEQGLELHLMWIGLSTHI